MSIEERIKLKFLVLLRKIPSQAFGILHQGYGDNIIVLSGTRGSKRVKRR